MIQWYKKKIQDLYDEFETSESGVSEEKVLKIREKYGPNKLPEGERESLFFIFLRQFKSPLIYILLIAGGVMFAIGDNSDAFIILVVLFFNAVIGTAQEGKAENALLSLKKLSKTSATVERDGKEIIISDEDLVPGDIILLQEGEKVPADARIIFSNNLRANESSLTGESTPVEKKSDLISGNELPISDQKNMVFKGTYIIGGNGRALVVATGIKTEIGKIAESIISIDTEMPLQAGVRSLAKMIIIGIFFAGLFILAVGLAQGKPVIEMSLTVVALAISAIPEGLPIVVTLVLAAGVWRMSKKNALVKKIQAVETLGHTKIIAVDKTGTITKNEMVVERLWVNDKLFEIEGNGYEPKGNISFEKKTIIPAEIPEVILSGKIAAYSSSARLSFIENNKEWKVAGDPTEAAMRVFGEKVGFRAETLDGEAPRVFEIPFDYKTRCHIVVREFQKKKFIAVTGAPEEIIHLSKKIWRDGKEEKITDEYMQKLEKEFSRLAREGFRVVALAYADGDGKDFEKLPPLTLVGFLGVRDALRPEVKKAIVEVEEAGMRVVMITGDHKLTAEAIAKEAGIYKDHDKILTGGEIEQLSDTALQNYLESVSVFARVTPEHKLRIIQAYRARGEVVAMTGDGVNDAPSLVAADLGLSLGKIGTEVAKDASDIVLTDDNFGSIVFAVEEGRNIFKTIKKVIFYLFSTNLGEFFVILGALMVGFPLPLLPAQIIWLNLVTDGFLDVALAMDPKEKGLMKERFPKKAKFFDSLAIFRIITISILMAIGTLYAFSLYIDGGFEKALTISLTTLAVFQWLNVWNCRSEYKSIFGKGMFSNKFLIGATFLVVALQFFAIYTPFMQKILHTTSLNLQDWMVAITLGLSVIALEEIRKLVSRKTTSLSIFSKTSNRSTII